MIKCCRPSTRRSQHADATLKSEGQPCGQDDTEPKDRNCNRIVCRNQHGSAISGPDAHPRSSHATKIPQADTRISDLVFWIMTIDAGCDRHLRVLVTV